MRPAFPLVLLLLASLTAAPADALETRDAATTSVKALAVSEAPEGLVGVAADVEATVLGTGSGQVFVSTKPLAATDMQGSARLAARVAAFTLGADPTAYDHLIEFTSGSTVIGGPSAGAVMTLALSVALHNVAQPEDPWTLDPRVAATGTINLDGTIGPVGGVPDKAQAAAEAGITLFLYPSGLENATTYEAGPMGLRPVQVDMEEHCADFGITCRPAATIRDLLQAATGVALERPDVPTPTTAEYGPQLRPGVADEVEELRRRIADVEAREVPAVAQEPLATARARLEDADSALSQDALYRAATRAFQGHINAGWAQLLTEFHAQGREAAVVEDAVERCDVAASEALAAVEGEHPRDLHEVYALAAAQERARTAIDLANEAQSQFDNALRFSQWEQALLTASFCIERAETAHWWLGIGDLFGAGPEIDLEAVLEDVLERAREMAAYADAVSPGSAAAAQRQLENARILEEERLLAGALGSAVQAEVLASVAVQTASSPQVPPDVMDAARQSAFQAIAQARARGIEPVLAVSLVELAEIQEEPADALADLWTARSLALLDAPRLGEPETTRTGTVDIPAANGLYSQESLLAFLIVGALAGGGLVAVVFSLWRPRF